MSNTTYYTLPAATCLHLYPWSLPHGDITYNRQWIIRSYIRRRSKGYTVGTVATFTCRDGYELKGSRTRTCDSTGDWGAIPQCQKKRDPLLAFIGIRVFTQTYNIGNGVKISIRKQKKNSNKMLPLVGIEPEPLITSDSKFNILLSTLTSVHANAKLV